MILLIVLYLMAAYYLSFWLKRWFTMSASASTIRLGLFAPILLLVSVLTFHRSLPRSLVLVVDNLILLLGCFAVCWVGVALVGDLLAAVRRRTRPGFSAGRVAGCLVITVSLALSFPVFDNLPSFLSRLQFYMKAGAHESRQLQEYAVNTSTVAYSYSERFIPPIPNPHFFAPIDSATWKIELPEGEAPAELQEGSLLYATKNEYTATLYKRNMRDGSQTKIFEYYEPIRADATGSYLNILPPSIALAPAKDRLAFIDKSGLKTYNLENGTTKSLIEQLTKGGVSATDPDDYITPQWSINSSTLSSLGIYALTSPSWSADGKYISFQESYYEESAIGIIEVQTGDYVHPRISGDYFTWAPGGHVFINGNYSDSDYNEFNISYSGNIQKWRGLSEITGGQVGSALEGSFSPDSKKIAFTYNDYGTAVVAITNIEGGGFKILDCGMRADSSFDRPIFFPDGNAVLQIQEKEKKRVLVKYGLSDNKIIDLAILPADSYWRQAFWTKEGFLALSGSLHTKDPKKKVARLLLLDLQMKKIIYVSPAFIRFTDFLGLI